MAAVEADAVGAAVVVAADAVDRDASLVLASKAVAQAAAFFVFGEPFHHGGIEARKNRNPAYGQSISLLVLTGRELREGRGPSSRLTSGSQLARDDKELSVRADKKLLVRDEKVRVIQELET
jgi:hypothetical protein